MIVYADVLFFINLVLNMTITWITVKVCHLRLMIWRWLLSALLGSIYVLITVLPEFDFLSHWPSKILLSMFIVMMITVPCSLPKYWLTLACFYLTSFVLGGAMFALLSTSFMEIIYGNPITLPLIKPSMFLIPLLCVVILGWICLHYLKLPFFHQNHLLSVKIVINDQTATIVGLVDTGNKLYDPISQTPVMVAELSTCKQLLPADLARQLSELPVEQWVSILDDERWQEWKTRFRVIPYAALGKSSVLLGIRPDRVTIYEQQPLDIGVIVALCKQRLSSYGDYHALLHPAMMPVNR